MIVSMTGYASAEGEHGDWTWSWDVRGVNGRGLDIRVRAPEWVDGLEPVLRRAIKERVARGTVSLGLRVARREREAVAALDSDAIETILAQIAAVEGMAAASGMPLAPSRATDILAMRPASDAGTIPPEDLVALREAIAVQFAQSVLPAFDAMRRSEGDAIAALLSGQLDRAAGLVATARRQAAARRESVAAGLREAMARIPSEVGADPERLAQELALLATRTDVTEELDRLDAHVAAARDLLSGEGPAGRKLDFLMQEFVREANTLCAKSQDVALTRTGLDLKTAIDQMREQVQNVE